MSHKQQEYCRKMENRILKEVRLFPDHIELNFHDGNSFAIKAYPDHDNNGAYMCLFEVIK